MPPRLESTHPLFVLRSRSRAGSCRRRRSSRTVRDVGSPGLAGGSLITPPTGSGRDSDARGVAGASLLIAESPASLRSDGVFGVHDAVAVSLFGEKPLPMGGEVGVNCVTSDHGVQARCDALRLGT